jgi:hypothetical protein
MLRVLSRSQAVNGKRYDINPATEFWAKNAGVQLEKD